MKSQASAPFLAKADHLYQAGRYNECVVACQQALKKSPRNVHLLDICALSYLMQGQEDKCIQSYLALLEISPQHFQANINIGKIHVNRSRHLEALPFLQTCMAQGEQAASVNYLIGLCHESNGDHAQAIVSFSNVLDQNPHQLSAYAKLAAALNQLQHLNAAVDVLDTGFKINPNAHDLMFYKGMLLTEKGRYASAQAAFAMLENLENPKIEYISAHADLLRKMRKLKESEEKYKQALEINDQHLPTLINYANLLTHLKKIDPALAIFDQVLKIEPENSMALDNVSNIMLMKRDFDRAWAYAERGYQILPNIAGAYIYTMSFHCEWSQYDSVVKKLDEDLNYHWSGPFSPIIFSNKAETHLGYAKNWAKTIRSTDALGPLKKYTQHKKIRIAYYTCDFFNHATAMLIEGMLQAHDRDLFELHAFSLDITQEDDYTRRIKSLFDHYHEVYHYSDRAISNLSRELEIDIAIDLKGYTEGSRTALFAERAAPVQINFLGFPGTMGADYIDYIVADDYLITPENRAFFSEKVIFMPDCYQPNHPGRPKPDGLSERPAELPKDKFIFCSFNNAYKITPSQFSLWMKILQAAPDSVLWMLKATERAEKNLLEAATQAGIDPSRIIFAKFLPEAQHLERLTHADLFLDSFPCNAHTTASDALWAGVPLLSRSGETFASRVAGSLLCSVGAAELIVANEEDYFDKALKIYQDPLYLAQLKALVKTGIQDGPLYNIQKFTREFETAMQKVHHHHQQDGAPEDVCLGA